MALRNKFARLGGASLLALTVGIASAEAATLVGLTADNKLVKVDTATMAASAPMAISGADKVVGIDVRPRTASSTALPRPDSSWSSTI